MALFTDEGKENRILGLGGGFFIEKIYYDT